ncbi:protein tesmin/TSO1-like CXC 5 [Senna tora]|uniref:Protein tesmin/TSO1-like CXC 5 n=1 Tax=Senna tora TaxID=362788 RepID=A0A834T8M7_9FABA|nr:protein tesmin/TSO1-like CXC 5 [Senna tora]
MTADGGVRQLLVTNPMGFGRTSSVQWCRRDLVGVHQIDTVNVLHREYIVMGANCNCVNCYNNVENEAASREAVEANLEGNPNAFRPKFAGSPHATRDSMVEERSDEVYCQVLLVPEKELVERKLLEGESDADGEEEDADAVDALEDETLAVVLDNDDGVTNSPGSKEFSLNGVEENVRDGCEEPAIKSESDIKAGREESCEEVTNTVLSLSNSIN